MKNRLAHSVTQRAGTDSNIRVGVVVSVDSASTITVNVAGGTLADMPYLSSYSPAVGDNVQIARFDATWLVVGAVGAPALSVVRGTIATNNNTTGAINTVETDLPFLATQEPLSVRAGHMYEMTANALTVQTVATDVFQWRFRRDVAVTGTEIGFQRFTNGVTTGSWKGGFYTIFEALITESFNVFVSLIRVTGTGNITANSVGGTTRCYMKVTDLGLNSTVADSPWSTT